ncbi:hypothetical protein C2W62_32915 [Candidatus Entotheonella serta]|nr:hypothetical protein C2W62_32915 [Candidatus Entotheonella serta]
MMADPIADMIAARARARQLGDPYVDVCFLSTVTSEGEPAVRAIALRDIEGQGIGLLINANSPKWQQLEATGQYVLEVFWATVQCQYRVGYRVVSNRWMTSAYNSIGIGKAIIRALWKYTTKKSNRRVRRSSRATSYGMA